MRIRKAIFPVAGLGTRFLPATKASPKEMMAVVDKPLIQYAVEEAIAAGVEDIIFVTGRHKRSIEDHFDVAYEVEQALLAKGDHQRLRQVQDLLPKGVHCIYVRQPRPLGLGHAVLCAAPVVGNEPFAVLLADDLIDAQPVVMAQMCAIYQQHRCSVLGVQHVPISMSRQYGMVAVSGAAPYRITSIVEKPAPEASPSDFGIVGRYVLTPKIFSLLEQMPQEEGVEMQLTDAIAGLLATEPVLAHPFTGDRYDCGQKLGFLQATVALGRKHPEVGAAFDEYLRSGTAGNGAP